MRAADPLPGKKKPKKKRDNRRFRFGTMATVLTAAAVAVVVLFNVVVGILADRFPLNLDLTKDKTYSLSDTSLEIIKSVDKDVQILIFADEELFRDNVSAGEQGKILRQFYEALNSCVSLVRRQDHRALCGHHRSGRHRPV